MNAYVNVNGIRVPVIRNKDSAANRLSGLKNGSIVIISNDCTISYDTQKYLESKNVKIIRVGSDWGQWDADMQKVVFA